MKKNGGGAFHPFKKEKNGGTIKTDPRVLVPATAASSTTEIGGGDCGGSGDGGGKKEDKEGQSQRKARRCWSPELHRRFLHALQQLGGSHGIIINPNCASIEFDFCFGNGLVMCCD